MWDLSDCFEVDEEVVRLRLEMLRAELEVHQSKKGGGFIGFTHKCLADRLGGVTLRHDVGVGGILA